MKKKRNIGGYEAGFLGKSDPEPGSNPRPKMSRGHSDFLAEMTSMPLSSGEKRILRWELVPAIETWKIEISKIILHLVRD